MTSSLANISAVGLRVGQSGPGQCFVQAHFKVVPSRDRDPAAHRILYGAGSFAGFPEAKSVRIIMLDRTAICQCVFRFEGSEGGEMSDVHED